MAQHSKPTDGELEILNVLWANGPSSVREVHEHLSKEAGYTTTLKLMQIMHQKGLLKRDAAAKVHIFEAAVDEGQTRGQLVQRMIDTVFNGSALSLVMQALGNHSTTQKEMEQILAYLEQESAKARRSDEEGNILVMVRPGQST